MKRVISFLLAIVAIATFSLFALGSGSNDTKDQGKSEAEKAQSSNTEIGDYSLDIQSCRLATDYEGKSIVIVKYLFTNVSSKKPESFSLAFDDKVYQNGVSLNECYLANDSANYNSDNQMKELQKGASLEVEVAYELNDTTTDIKVEVEELFSFNDQKITKTFSIV